LKTRRSRFLLWLLFLGSGLLLGFFLQFFLNDSRQFGFIMVAIAAKAKRDMSKAAS